MKNFNLSEDFKLVACNELGAPTEPVKITSTFVAENAAATAAHYITVGYEPPWIGYLAVVDGVAVGGGAFVCPLQNGEVEIAYFTAPEFEGRGFASKTAAALITIAKAARLDIAVIANTLPKENASTRILQRLGFCRTSVTQDDEVGEAWVWRLGVGT